MLSRNETWHELEGLLKSLGILMKQFLFVCAVPVNIHGKGRHLD